MTSWFDHLWRHTRGWSVVWTRSFPFGLGISVAVSSLWPWLLFLYAERLVSIASLLEYSLWSATLLGGGSCLLLAPLIWPTPSSFQLHSFYFDQYFNLRIMHACFYQHLLRHTVRAPYWHFSEALNETFDYLFFLLFSCNKEWTDILVSSSKKRLGNSLSISDHTLIVPRGNCIN